MHRLIYCTRGVLVLGVLGLLSACASVPRTAGFEDVETTVQERAGYSVYWYQGGPEDAETRQALTRLLEDTLSVEAAVQVALLNNRRLQATYEDLGVAQAAVVQAGLLRNPIFGGEVLFPTEGGSPDLGFKVAFDFLNVFYLPLRKAVARSAFAAAKLRVGGAVLDLTGQVRIAFYRAQAAAQRLELLEQVLTVATAGYEAAVRLHAAGNIPDLSLHTEQALFEQARLALVAADANALAQREALNQVLGLWGPQASYAVARRLPRLPAQDAPLDSLETQALAASLDLAAARQDIETYARRLGLTNTTALLPDLELEAAAEREEGAWKAGPGVSFALPLFDFGQARRATAQAELRRRQATYFALGVDVRTAARIIRHRIHAAAQVARQYRDVLVPLQARITQETQRQYNAMQIGVFELLQAKNREVEAGLRYIETLEAYWLAHTDLLLLQQGRLPSRGTSMPVGPLDVNPARAPNTEDH